MGRIKRLYVFTVFVVVVITIYAFTGCKNLGKKQQIDISNYVDYSFSGYDGNGVINYSVDYDQLCDDLEDNKIKFDEDDVQGSIKVSINKTKNLSNGEEIEVELGIKRSLEENVHATFICEDIKITVSGLEERVSFDPFQYINVIYSGIAPEGSAIIERTGASPIDGIEYSIISDNQGKNLKNGDTIKVSASVPFDNFEDICLDAGFVLETTTKEYTVEGLDSYATSISQISTELIAELNKQSEDVFYSHTKWGSDETVDSFEYVGGYVLSIKDGLSVGYGESWNYYYMVYKVTVTNPGETFSYYYYVRYRDVITKTDGSSDIYDINEVDYPYGIYYPYSGSTSGAIIVRDNKYNYIGYIDISSLYNDEIRPQSQYYNIDNIIENN